MVGPMYVIKLTAMQQQGVYKVKLYVETASGCMPLQIVNITVSPNPTVNLSYPNYVCLQLLHNSIARHISERAGKPVYLCMEFWRPYSDRRGQTQHIIYSTGPFDVKLIITSNMVVLIHLHVHLIRSTLKTTSCIYFTTEVCFRQCS